MQEELAILLEWFEANGISEFFYDDLNTENLEVNHIQRGVAGVVNALVEQQNNIIKSSSIFGDNEEIRKFADSVNNIDAIKNFINNFSGYKNFRETAKSTLLLDGNINSDILVINDMPDIDDDNSSKIFSNNSDKLLNNALSSVFKHKYDICFLNLFFWRLPGGRQPIKEELNCCRPLVERIISIIKPKFIVFCGSYGVSTFLEDNKTVFNMRGKIVEYTNCYIENKIKSTATYSPYLILKNGAKKKEFWNDILFVYNYVRNM